ncbi:bifunctional cobalt-precorrin-7 (C(5))-methyltransferase/cobalt-precorrin-6B (C(15))-methyltransferase [Polycladidibacter stylochi]|uniref:bifunctional cobalt-precorrin-7 (C(5))-methyltransferase/cobalt-precorrin-6B (C(15))-methyltransferase n=1 Tax=Polycladidibacter stylochi TaxID=1807766 RepID=UPI0008338A84|nr:bifunctional cobalt-precorrin-7 (C(5))-methyltransferase/cobalt-precorrin-6B (C(15))-methyltransferase [Pseudovibrio stylochi]
MTTQKNVPWLTIIGMGEDGPKGLSPLAQEAIASAKHIMAGKRHLELLGETHAQTMVWPKPFSQGIEQLKQLRSQECVVIASGDPYWFGVGATLADHFEKGEVTCLPHPSSFSLAAAQMHWKIQEVQCISLHGRPLDQLRACLFHQARLLLLTSNGDSPTEIADILTDEGYGASTLTVLEHLGGDKQAVHSSTAETYQGPARALNVVAVEAIANSYTPHYGRLPGLPDSAFHHDGKLTKQEVRAVTLAQLRPVPGELLWDIGTGCGSIAIEWLRAAPHTKAIAFEPDNTRRARARGNAAGLGVPHLQLQGDKAPECLEGLAAPDAIFIGGGLTAPKMIESCVNLLKKNGRLVANAVTTEGEMELLKAHKAHGGELRRIAVSRAQTIGTLTGFRPLMTVTQWNWTKK